MNKGAIIAEDLTYTYGQLRAVDHISFSVAEGEIMGFQLVPSEVRKPLQRFRGEVGEWIGLPWKYDAASKAPHNLRKG